MHVKWLADDLSYELRSVAESAADLNEEKVGGRTFSMLKTLQFSPVFAAFSCLMFSTRAFAFRMTATFSHAENLSCSWLASSFPLIKGQASTYGPNHIQLAQHTLQLQNAIRLHWWGNTHILNQRPCQFLEHSHRIEAEPRLGKMAQERDPVVHLQFTELTRKVW